jgi:hypothetical protein
MSRTFPVCLVALITGLWSLSLPAQEVTGTLIFDVKPFTSEVKLKEKIEKQLKTGGIEWGTAEGQLVVSLVNKRFIRFDLPNMTRYGESKSLELAPGSYRLSCVGFVPEGGFSVDKALRKGAYFNLDVLTFDVVAGRTITLEVYPTIQAESTFLLKFYVPQLLVKILDEGTVRNESVINDRTAASIAWDDYDGPLKFTVEPEAVAPTP